MSKLHPHQQVCQQGFGLPSHAWASHLRPHERWCHPIRQGEKDKSPGVHCLPGSWVAWCTYAFHSWCQCSAPGRSWRDFTIWPSTQPEGQGKQKEGECMSEEHPCLSLSLQWAISHDSHQNSLWQFCWWNAPDSGNLSTRSHSTLIPPHRSD